MKAKERRKEIVTILMSCGEPISGGELSEKLSVSRQIIVQDIAVLRAEGYEILSLHTGYVIKKSSLAERVFKVRHTSEQTVDELSLIVENGGIVVDVFVWHRAYGKISAPLNISTMKSVERFMEDIKSGKSRELMNITDGYHYHTVRADSETALDVIEKLLENKGYLAPEK